MSQIRNNGEEPSKSLLNDVAKNESAARVLVVDDEESLRITTAAILEKDGYVVHTASSGDEAISLLRNVD